jgi:hypothetical protein
MTRCVMQEEQQGWCKQPRVFPFRIPHDTRKNVAVTYISIIAEKSQQRKGGVL